MAKHSHGPRRTRKPAEVPAVENTPDVIMLPEGFILVSIEDEAKVIAARADAERQAAMAGEQRDWLISHSNRLLSRLVGVQLANDLTTIEAAADYVNAERACADQAMQGIEAKHTPEQPAEETAA